MAEVNLNIPIVQHDVPFIDDDEFLPMKETNLLMNTEHSEYDVRCQLLIEYFMNCPITGALTKEKEVPEKLLQQFVHTFDEVEENQLSAHVWENVSVTLTPARVREWLELPILDNYVEAPSRKELLSFIVELGYKNKKINKFDSTTERASREVFKCSSSLEEDEEQKSKSSKEAEGERILMITNTSNDAENDQTHEGRIHLDFDILQETAQEHHAESQIAGRIHEEVQFGGTEIETTEVIHHEESHIAEHKETEIDKEVTSAFNLNSESENEEEYEVSTDRDQETHQGNLEKGNMFTLKTYGESHLDVIQGHKEIQDESMSLTTGGDGTGKLKATPNSENLERMLEKAYKICKRNPVEEKLDMLLSEIQGQRAEMKILSESVEAIKKQTDDNTEALKSLQKMKEKAPELNISASEIQTILTEIEKIKTQVLSMMESSQSSSRNKVLEEEIAILRASNNSITDALEKLSKEWAENQKKAQAEFNQAQKNMANNSKLVRETQQLMERMQFNVASLAKVDPQKLMKQIPDSSSHQKAPKTTPQQSTTTPITKADTTVMGPPPNIPKEEMLKRLAAAKPHVITNLKMLAAVPNPTISDDSAISKYMNIQTMKEWEEKGESEAKSKIVKRKISESKSIMVKEIARDVMIFPEYNLVSYYLTKEDEIPRSVSPTRLGLREERMKRGPYSIHKHNENPVKRFLKVEEMKVATDDIGGTFVQNRYTLQREKGDEQKVTDEELADELHPLDILFMKDNYEKEKKNNQETSKDGEQEYGVIFRDQDNNKALFRSVDICKYSNQTLRYILRTMNRRQEHLQKIEKNLEGSRKEIEQIIEEWIQAREWYKDMYDSCNKYISYKKKITKGDMHKRVKLN
ncbi:early endosome antigen 1-like [Helianthus annuus]|uniref:early endosome antigen 1-like n=1 Tax=Helianthus annuus TaxID=4232 RepID=UPI001652F236|nr:early endosome antigen 1-like [Helianthus annuus]